MSLPAPENYSDWQSWARATNRVLQDSGFDPLLPQGAGSGVPGGGGGGGPATSVTLPPGYEPVWLNTADSQLFLGNANLDPPTAPDLFQIDNLNLLNAIIDTNKLADDAVTAAKILNATIGTAEIANAAIVSALIGDLQVITAKIADAAINNAKIANLAVDSAKIANLSVGTAQIIDLAVSAAKIALATITNAQISDATITTAKIGLAQITQALIANLAVGSAQIIDASILSAKIADLAVIGAKIANAAVGSAQIANLAVGTAHIQDASITTAKILSLVVDKISSGTLDATIDIGTGMFKFSVGSSALFIGRGFGTTSQFFLWFGPNSFTPATADEASATIYFKTNGDAYFGGSLSSGVLKNEGATTSTSATASVTVGPFASNGSPINVNASYFFRWRQLADASTGAIGPNSPPDVVILVEKRTGAGAWTTLATLNANESFRQVEVDGDPAVKDIITWEVQGGSTSSWTPGVVADAQLRATITSRNVPTISGTGLTTAVLSQSLGVVAVES